MSAESRTPCRCPLAQTCNVARLGRGSYCRRARLTGRAEWPLDWPASLRQSEPSQAPSPAVFREGWEAGISGKPKTTNPYADDVAAAEAWHEGWLDARHERQKDRP